MYERSPRAGDLWSGNAPAGACTDPKAGVVLAMEGTVLELCPEGQTGLDGAVAHTTHSVFQDELSHINARLNMGILGCEYAPGFHPLGLGWGWWLSEAFQAQSQLSLGAAAICSWDHCCCRKEILE